MAKLGPKAYEQCAGFMRITDGKNPLDATGVHPESYDATKKLLDKLGFTMEDVKTGIWMVFLKKSPIMTNWQKNLVSEPSPYRIL